MQYDIFCHFTWRHWPCCDHILTPWQLIDWTESSIIADLIFFICMNCWVHGGREFFMLLVLPSLVAKMSPCFSSCEGRCVLRKILYLPVWICIVTYILSHGSYVNWEDSESSVMCMYDAWKLSFVLFIN